MNSATNNRRIWLCTIFMVLIAVAAFFAHKTENLTAVRMAAHNVLSPGRMAVLAISATATSRNAAANPETNASRGELADLQQALLENELQRRQLLIENARLHNQVRTMNRLSDAEAVASYNLVDFIALKAVVLSHNGLSGPLTEAFVDAGRSQGLRKSQLVVDGTGVVLDKGTDHGLESGQKVTFGTAVIGRIEQVSQWVSLVQPVTHKDFSAAVQIVKLAPQGASFGAQGLLEGTGADRCRVTGIAYTDAVAVGDEVFSADINGTQGPKLYYGRVVRADFSSGGSWNVEVEPAINKHELTEVSIVQPRLNINRISSQSDRRSHTH